MPGCYIYVWLFLFAVFAEDIPEVKVETGLYSRVELTGNKLQTNQYTVESVEWTKLKNGPQVCLIFVNNGTNGIKFYGDCRGKAHFYLNNNTLILENVTAQDEGVFKETIVRRNGTKKIQTFKLIIQYPPNATEIVLTWNSSTSVTLKCEVSGSFLYLMWKRERVPVLEKHRYLFSERNQTLYISNITSSDYGTYSCVVSNAYGESEQHINIGENSTVNQGNGTSGQTQSGQKLLSSGLTLIGVVGLCIMFYGLYKYHHRQRAENGRTTDEGDADNNTGIYQEVSDFQQMTPLPYVYTDFIKPKEPNQASAATQHFEDFGYSEVGPTCMAEPELQYCHEQFTACPDTGEE